MAVVVLPSASPPGSTPGISPSEGQVDPVRPSEPLEPEDQLSFLSDPDVPKIGKFQRPGDAAETQRLAALLAYPSTGTWRRRVLNAIAFAGEQGRTDEELQNQLNLNPSTQRPRRVELVEGGWVEDSERRRRTKSGRDAVVWIATEAARKNWKG